MAEVEKAIERLQRQLADPYDGGIWEGKKFNKEPFVTIRADDLRTLLAAYDRQKEALEWIKNYPDSPLADKHMRAKARNALNLNQEK